MLQTVAVGTDGTPTADKAVAAAIELAASSSARLVLISAYRNGHNDQISSEQGQAPPDIQWAMNPAGEADTILNQAEDRARAHGLRVTKVVRAGNPAEVLCELAAEKHADVLVIGNKGMHRRVLGSVPNSIAHKASCSVLIVKTT